MAYDSSLELQIWDSVVIHLRKSSHCELNRYNSGYEMRNDHISKQ